LSGYGYQLFPFSLILIISSTWGFRGILKDIEKKEREKAKKQEEAARQQPE
jgi:hypothetical protein